MTRKLPAYTTDDISPSMNSGKCCHFTRNFAIAVPHVSTPPPAADASIFQYSRRDDVT